MLIAAISIAVIGTGYAEVTTSQSSTMARTIVAIPVSFATFLSMMLGGSGSVTLNPSKPTPVVQNPPVLTPTPAPKPAGVGMQLGVNVNAQSYWSGQRSFSNLLYASTWALAETKKGIYFEAMPAERLDASGNVKFLNPGDYGIKLITPPPALRFGKPVNIRCTFLGKGELSAGNGPVNNVVTQSNGVTFTWHPVAGADPTAYIEPIHLRVVATDPSNPVRRLDCRETTASPDAIFDPAFIASFAPYRVVRFMEWQGVNSNNKVTWATRATVNTENLSGPDGPPLEYLVALANQANVDPWFSISWNADDDYVRRYATYVRDNVDPSHKIYVELSNEVWNGQFPVYRQAATEGLAAKLAGDEFKAAMLRYAQKTTSFMKIWTEVFAQQPNRIVRVVSSQNANPWVAEQILSFPGTADYVDALATAPYFGHDAFNGANATAQDLGALFASLKTSMDAAFTSSQGNADLAAKYKKRFIAYEAGQHLVSNTDERHLVMNRDPRMGEMYARYLAAWKARFNDVMMLYSDTGSYSRYGAFPMMEYPGQPLAQAPKAAAVKTFASTLK
ncbi:hypothetical protein FHS92_000190 [Sphingobium subterraneum]|uniref:Cellulose-binding protein n=2 Tax=Sphingobium subterraneum TaxID=627688 RepID=A0A841IUX8_9SPHN|nr:hypothetical protein [Sphingobium subterraneum]